MARLESSNPALKLWVVLARAHAAIAHHAESDINRHGLGLAEFAAMEVLYHKGPTTLGEIQRKILISSGGITYVIDRLVQKALVVREACPSDRRATYAKLTAAGESLMDDIFPAHEARLLRALGGLDAAEQAAAVALLRQLGKHAAAVPDDGE
jgi:MarR family 2-MHQ and catechol resistance regulon transcriptional repressor